MDEGAAPKDGSDPPRSKREGDKQGKRTIRFSFARFAYISQFSGEVVFCAIIGLWVDFRWKVAPCGVITGVVLGATAATYHLIRNVLRPKD